MKIFRPIRLRDRKPDLFYWTRLIMDLTTTSVVTWLAANIPELVTTVLILFIFFVVDRVSTPKLQKSADDGRFKEGSEIKAIRLVRITTGFVGWFALLGVWGIELRSIFIAASTVLTLLAVALVAGWSLLSNVTAHFILLLQPSFRRGNFIRIIDADNYTEGFISELYLFNTKLVTENRDTIIYPNNLILTRQVIINPRDKLHGVGKLPVHQAVNEDAGVVSPL